MTLDEAVALVPPGCDWLINNRGHAEIFAGKKSRECRVPACPAEALAKAAKQIRVDLGLDHPDQSNPAFRAGVERLRDLILECIGYKPTSVAYPLSSERASAVEHANALAYQIQKIAADLLKTE